MYREWHSSPLKSLGPELGSIHAIEARQKARADRLYQPLSSPTRQENDTSQRSQLREQMKRMRDEIRDRKKELLREKTVYVEDKNARLKQLQSEADALDLDLDLLLQEEELEKNNDVEVRALSQADSLGLEIAENFKISSTSTDTKYIREWEDELEELLAAEELELEEQLRDLQI